MIITPTRTEFPTTPRRMDRLRRPKTSHPLLREEDTALLKDSDGMETMVDLVRVDSVKSINEIPVAVPPFPRQFLPNTSMLILATQKRLASIRPTLARPGTSRSKKISRTRRVKSATARSETSDDETNASQTDAEWHWMSEPFDYDADPEDEDKPAAKRKEIHSVAVYKAACMRFGQVPSQHVCRNMATRELVLKNSHVDSSGAKAIAVALVVNGSIETVNLEGNIIGAQGAAYICEALQENNFISELNLAHNGLLTNGIKTVCKAIGNSQHLRILDISGNGLEDFDAVHIANMLKDNYALKELIMHHNSLRERGGMILGNAVAENDTLEKLDVSWNTLRRKGATAMCECLRKNIGLKSLDISWNGLYLDGAKALRRSLPENKTLIELNISNNRLTEECMRDIMVGLKRNQTLKILKIANSPMPLTGCMWFLNALMNLPNSAIEVIDMTNQTVDLAFVRRYEELRRVKGINIAHGVVSPPYLDLDDGENPSDVFINDDPMIVLMEYMRIQNLRLLDLFSSLDVDHSQSLSREEFRTGMLNANIPLSAEALDRLIKELDTDMDGEVDFNELLEGLKAHKKKVSKIMAKQKHMKFEDTSIGKINLKINALLQFRMMYHRINLARSRSEQEALETTLQEYNDKLSDLSSLKKNMLQAGMQRAKAQALERKISRISSTSGQPALATVVEQVKPKLTANMTKMSKTEERLSAGSEGKKKRLAKIARAMSAPARKK